MSGEIKDEKGLLFDIRYALRKVPVCRSRDERQSDSWRNLVAGYILDHLKLANWVVRKGEPWKRTNAPIAGPLKSDGE